MVNEAVSGLGLMMTIAEPEAETVLLSVTENDSVLLPFAGSVTLKLPVPTYGVVPPTAETLQKNGTPATAVAGQVTDTTNGCGETVIVSDADAVMVFESVTSNDSMNVPLTASVTANVPVPEYGPVPPVAETMQLKGSPAVRGTPSDPQETVTTNGWPDTTTLSEPEALTLLESLTVNDSVNVPLVGSVMVKLPVPEYGEVPPDAETMQLNGFPSVAGAEAAHVTVTDKGCGSTITLAIASALTPFASVTVKASVKVPLDGTVTEKSPVPL